MIRHVVLWKLKDFAEGKTKEENQKIIRDFLLALPAKIPQIRRMEVGFDFSATDASMDLLLLSEFDTKKDLQIYAVHPEHLAVAAYVKKVVETRMVLDCEI